MNEPLFKNSFVREKQMYKELYQSYYFKTPIFLILYVLFAIQILISFSVSMGNGLFALFCGSLIVLLGVFVCSLNIKTALARDNERGNGKELLNELFVYDDSIELEMFGNKDTLSFSNIKRVSESKNYIFVQTKARMAYVLKKDSFTLGTSDEFIEFLKSKGVKVQK